MRIVCSGSSMEIGTYVFSLISTSLSVSVGRRKKRYVLGLTWLWMALILNTLLSSGGVVVLCSAVLEQKDQSRSRI